MEQKTYAEQIVKKKKSPKTIVLQTVAVLAVIIVLIIASAIPQIATIVPAAAALLLLATYILVRNMNVEYEYSVVESDLRVALIRGKSSRKQLISTDVKTFDIFSYVESNEQLDELAKRVNTVYYAVGDKKNIEGCWFAVFSKGGEEGKTLLIIKPNSAVLSLLLRYIPPRNVQNPAEEKK